MYTYYIINNQNHLIMSKVSVFDQGWIDLVFEGRNQEYGAYQLRKQDSKTTMLALFTGIGIMVLLVSIPVIINKFSTHDVISDEGLDIPPQIVVKVEDYVLPETPKPQPVVEQPAAAAAQSNVPTIQFTPLAPTSQPVTTTITTQDLNTALPAGVTTTGEGEGPAISGIGTAPTGNGPAITGPASGPGVIENFVDVAPVYPGGLPKFYQDVANRFKTPDVDNLSTIKVLVSFVVEPDGTLSNVKATRDPGYGLGEEAVRVLRSLKAKWKPGLKGGKAVRTAYSLPITVKVN